MPFRHIKNKCALSPIYKASGGSRGGPGITRRGGLDHPLGTGHCKIIRRGSHGESSNFFSPMMAVLTGFHCTILQKKRDLMILEFAQKCPQSRQEMPFQRP